MSKLSYPEAKDGLLIEMRRVCLIWYLIHYCSALLHGELGALSTDVLDESESALVSQGQETEELQQP